MLASEDDVVFLDASPAYLRTPAAAPRVQQALPHAKFVIILRVCILLTLDPSKITAVPKSLLYAHVVLAHSEMTACTVLLLFRAAAGLESTSIQ